MKKLISACIAAVALNGAVAASEDTVMVTVQCVPTEAAMGFLEAQGAVLAASDVFSNGSGLLMDSIWVSPDRIFVLRSSKQRGNTCVLTEVPTKAEI